MPEVLEYVEIDLRSNPEVSASLLPNADFNKVVLLRIEPDTYEQLVLKLRAICAEEGNQWLTSLLFKPETAVASYSDLELGGSYILVAHVSLVGADVQQFLGRLTSLKKLVVN